MLERRNLRQKFRVLLVHSHIGTESAGGRACRTLANEFADRNIETVTAANVDDGRSMIMADSALHAMLIDWSLPGSDGGDGDNSAAIDLINTVRSRNENVPIFLMTEPGKARTLNVEIVQAINELIWISQDSATFVAGRVQAAMKIYLAALLGPLTTALANFNQVHEYSWHTPGHTGGTAFLKHPTGRAFYDFYGEHVFRTDLSISVGEIGSLLDHTGPIGESEKYISRIFGSHRSYTVTNGSSTSNRIIFMACVGRDQVVLCDRNCHKSIEHGLTMTGGVPHYLVPSRNRYGLIGPIYPDKFVEANVRNAVANNSLSKGLADQQPVFVVVTNSTYDGLCYNTKRVLQEVGGWVDRVHFDEAWYGYGRFNPLYAGRLAMHGPASEHDPNGPTVFTTHSTHKLLAAFSQASYIHVRDGRGAIPHARFNESFMMHGSTSPFYPIIASNEVAASMMDGVGGLSLTRESIDEAINFRQIVGRLNRDFANKGSWFFRTWNPDEVTDENGNRVAFADASPEWLATDSNAWVLHPGETWHGFGQLEDGYCMLDPIKVSVLTPGVQDDESFADHGFPATLLTAYLDARGIEVEKTSDFAVLFLFSIGITKAKWSTLVTAMLDFKRDYDENRALERVMPNLVASHPERYAGLGLRDLGNQMFAELKKTGQTRHLQSAYSNLPEIRLTPADAYQQLIRGRVERVALGNLANRTLATSVVPYPPGIPMLMPGEVAGPADGPYIGYLRALQSWDHTFPGFGHDTHGVEVEDGEYYIQCLKS
ncbi:Orn/Lys/Arg decarboxylase N-terminal domain-containing protein [Dyella jiangningensis]|uniref:Orn/Lys/Arg family decarboxylase n=1 Tax=Dyella jiangningensis TaxID=1379159 RepID=UPI00240F715C|nr:Orn/Lys/Arg decarboxylase N-terminal domain-containing protein [Dyella jiangningensis]MDG2536917.1 Orn/Lys/Arg decarboxylase N-terminal domain-containing protein [Dyella jiangningensis]